MGANSKKLIDTSATSTKSSVGLSSGNTYSFAERGPEMVLPTGREQSGASYGGAGGAAATANLQGLQIVGRLDLGNGLEGRMEGVVVKVIDAAITRGNANP